MDRTELKRYRTELIPKKSQEEMAKECGIKFGLYRNVEQGKNTTYTTATKILHTLNILRVQQGLEEVRLEDLGLNIV